MKNCFSMLRTMCACMGLIFPVAASAATEVPAGTNITDPAAQWTVAGSPYLLKGDVSVTSGGILTIDADVTVQFDTPATLTIGINSALIARGTSGAEIRFTAPLGSTYNTSIKFASSVGATYDAGGSYVSGSILEHVIVENIGDVVGNTGGAVQAISSYPFIHLSTFRNNHSPAFGADVIPVGGAVLKVVGNTFTGQVHGINGGAIAILGNPGAYVVISDNVIRNNITSGNAGGLLLQNVGQLEMLRNVIEGNLGVRNGGGANVSGGSAVISANTFRNNKATTGGGLMVSQMASTVIADNVVIGNTASFESGDGVRGGMGGGIYVEAGTYTIERNIVAANLALRHSGGIDLHEKSSGALNVIVRNNVIAESAASGPPSAISAWEGDGEIYSNAIVENNYRAPIYLKSTGFKLYGNTIALNVVDIDSMLWSTAIVVGCPGYVGATVYCPADGGVINGEFIFDNNIEGNRTQLDLGWEERNLAKALTLGSNWWGSNADPLLSGRVDSNGGEFSIASWATARIATNPIAPPSGVVATAKSESELHVSWNPVEGSSGYRVFWGKKASPDFEEVRVLPGGTTSYDITRLSGGNYYVAVTALKAAYVAANDIAATPVNDNMTRGDESWYGHAPTATIPKSDLGVTMSSDSEAGIRFWNGQMAATDVIHHRIVVTNYGPSDVVGGYSVTDTIPAGMTLDRASTMPDCVLMMDGDVMCTRLTLALGSSFTFVIPLKVVDTSSTTLHEFTNTVHVTPNSADPDLTNNQASLKVRVNTHDLSVAWTNPGGTVAPNTNKTYTVVTRNLGRMTAPLVSLRIVLPADINVVAVSAGCTLATSIVTCPLRAMAANNQVSSSITVNAPAGLKTLRAEVTSIDADAEFDASNNVAIVTTNVTNSIEPEDPASSGGAVGVEWLLLLFVLLALRRYAAFPKAATAP